MYEKINIDKCLNTDAGGILLYFVQPHFYLIL